MNWEEFIKIWQDSEPRHNPIFFRLYHDDQGRPLSYSMEDMPGNYIDIDALTYQRSDFNVRVVDGKLVDVPKRTTVIKLKPVGTGTPCDPADVTVVVNNNQPNIKWDKTYEN